MNRQRNWSRVDWNWSEHGEVNESPSMTIPDQSLTIRQIMDRYVRGLPIDGTKVPIYEGDVDRPDFEHMDLAEREQWVYDAQEELKLLREQIAAARGKGAGTEKPPEPISSPVEPVPNTKQEKGVPEKDAPQSPSSTL